MADRDFFFSPERDALGSTPSPEAAMYILESAAECARKDQAECGWSSDVHHEVLSQALRRRQSGRTYKTLVKFMACSTAMLTKEYKLASAPDKKIDYCIYIDPAYDTDSPDVVDLIDNLRIQLPLYSISITSELSLLKTPLAIPIEIKRSGEGGDDAALQVYTWLEAQMEFLRRLIKRCPGTTATIDDIGFLPGLIIQGHTWNFVAATSRGHETVIWSDMCIGATSDIVGIYQIVTFLQMLREWTVKRYWPWLKELIRRATSDAVSLDET